MFVLTVFSLSAYSQSTPKALLVNLSDGTEVVFDFSKKPVMQFSEGTITLTCTDKEVNQWEFVKVKSWKFIESTGVDSKALKGNKLFVDNNYIHAEAYKKVDLNIYDTTGKKVFSKHINENETINIPLSTLLRGIYIVQLGDTTVKFMSQ